MKRFLLLTLTFFLLGGINAQTVVFEEAFDDVTNIPVGWTTLDQDGDGNIWIMNEFEEETYIVSESWIDPNPLTPNNYLISPQIDLTSSTGTLTLNYSIAAAGGSYYAENYSVAISATGTNVEDFTDTVFTEILDESVADGVWGARQIDLSNYTESSIYITWIHHDCTDMYKLMLDNVNIIQTSPSSIGELTKTSSIYPNPTNGIVKFNLANDSEISILDLSGKILMQKTVNSKDVIDISDFDKGTYIIRISNDNETTTKKIILQ